VSASPNRKKLHLSLGGQMRLFSNWIQKKTGHVDNKTSLQETVSMTPLDESQIAGILVIISSPTFDMSEDDAIELFAKRNPTWSRRHNVKLLRTDRQISEEVEGREEVFSKMVSSGYPGISDEYSVLVQDGNLTTVNRETGIVREKVIFGLFTFFRSDMGKKIVMFGNLEIKFRHNEFQITKPELLTNRLFSDLEHIYIFCEDFGEDISSSVPVGIIIENMVNQPMEVINNRIPLTVIRHSSVASMAPNTVTFPEKGLQEIETDFPGLSNNLETYGLELFFKAFTINNSGNKAVVLLVYKEDLLRMYKCKCCFRIFGSDELSGDFWTFCRHCNGKIIQRELLTCPNCKGNLRASKGRDATIFCPLCGYQIHIKT